MYENIHLNIEEKTEENQMNLDNFIVNNDDFVNRRNRRLGITTNSVISSAPPPLTPPSRPSPSDPSFPIPDHECDKNTLTCKKCLKWLVIQKYWYQPDSQGRFGMEKAFQLLEQFKLVNKTKLPFDKVKEYVKKFNTTTPLIWPNVDFNPNLFVESMQLQNTLRSYCDVYCLKWTGKKPKKPDYYAWNLAHLVSKNMYVFEECNSWKDLHSKGLQGLGYEFEDLIKDLVNLDDAVGAYLSEHSDELLGVCSCSKQRCRYMFQIYSKADPKRDIEKYTLILGSTCIKKYVIAQLLKIEIEKWEKAKKENQTYDTNKIKKLVFELAKLGKKPCDNYNECKAMISLTNQEGLCKECRKVSCIECHEKFIPKNGEKICNICFEKKHDRKFCDGYREFENGETVYIYCEYEGTKANKYKDKYWPKKSMMHHTKVYGKDICKKCNTKLDRYRLYKEIHLRIEFKKIKSKVKLLRMCQAIKNTKDVEKRKDIKEVIDRIKYERQLKFKYDLELILEDKLEKYEYQKSELEREQLRKQLREQRARDKELQMKEFIQKVKNNAIKIIGDYTKKWPLTGDDRRKAWKHTVYQNGVKNPRTWGWIAENDIDHIYDAYNNEKYDVDKFLEDEMISECIYDCLTLDDVEELYSGFVEFKKAKNDLRHLIHYKIFFEDKILEDAVKEEDDETVEDIDNNEKETDFLIEECKWLWNENYL
tara:strand:- start:255 stop:2369 length:2115 start_codon:yes stop_codon:yes gene_type:complete